ncbi:MAG: hypothetical protein KDD02_24095 [Phaeodactylibacter sp.]|nr:hypothetical protein [Phaeodactylibacter sp.]MCB9301180.1 hypothetical protein [Lewinellaceae bacterium]
MKNLKFLFLLFAITGMVVTWQSCDKDNDEPEATCSDGIQNGDETGVDCGGSCAPCEIGVQGKWQSSGANVAPLLVTLFNTDSIYAEFKTDNTYVVEQYDNTGAKLTLTGTYSQKESGVGNIWEITVNQSAPAVLTSEGIFEITGNTMKYEIAQTSPDIGAVPATAAAGFGSTNGGAFGMTNVQTYERIE